MPRKRGTTSAVMAFSNEGRVVKEVIMKSYSVWLHAFIINALSIGPQPPKTVNGSRRCGKMENDAMNHCGHVMAIAMKKKDMMDSMLCALTCSVVTNRKDNDAQFYMKVWIDMMGSCQK